MDTTRRSSSSSVSDEDDCSDDSSNSYYSDSDSYIPDWDSHIQEDGGLLYIVKKNDCHQTDSLGLLTKTDVKSNILEKGNFKRQSIRRSSKGTWLKILQRRNSKRAVFSNQKNDLDSNLLLTGAHKQNQSDFNNKLQLKESDEKNEPRELIIEVDFTKIHHSDNKLETLFGITTNVISDKKQLAVSKILCNSPAYIREQIRMGDYLVKIDDKFINANNIDDILNTYPETKQQVKLTVQRAPITGVKIESILKNSDNYIIDHITSEISEHEIVLNQVLRDQPVAVIYLDTERLTENNSEGEGVLYCYPRPEKHNFLCTSRGAFITLNHLIPEVLKNSKPNSCCLIVKNCLVNVVYTNRNSQIMLLALPEKKCNLFELSLINKEVVSVLELCYKTLHDCFTNSKNLKKVDHLFSRLFSQILTYGYSWRNKKNIRIENIVLCDEMQSEPLFEECLPIIQSVNLPWEARLQIDDALTELDATYISSTHQDVDMQDVFHIIGTSLYYAGHLLSSHLLQTELMAVHCFLRLQGFLSISFQGNVKNLILWREIFLGSIKNTNSESESFDDTNFTKAAVPNYRTFLILIAREHLLLVTLLRGRQNVEYVPPSPYFIEECESTIDLLVEVGLDNFLHLWFQSNIQPQIMLCPEEFINSSKYKEGTSAGFGKKTLPVAKSADIQSISKKQISSEQINNMQNSTFKDNQSKTHTNATYSDSDESDSQDSTSEFSEERIQGRRAARDKENNMCRNSASSSSCAEWEGYEANSQISGSYELADLSQSLFQKMGVFLPTKITAGEQNVCFHFVRLENELGILLAPTMNVQSQSDSELYKHILINFKKTSQKIHTLLQNTLKFKRMLSPSSSVNKSLVAIKEHGILFEISLKSIDKSNMKKNDEPFYYWVIGRLFEYPKFTEVYVCYHESVPQNLVDIAFRTAFTM